MNAERLLDSLTFRDLFDLEEIQKLQDEFSEAAEVASIITSPDGTPITKPSHFTRLCSNLIRETEQGRINCFKSDAEIGKFREDGPTIMPCLSCGLWDAGAGISVKGKHIANWLIGQVRDSSQNDSSIRNYAEKIGIDKDTAVDAFHEIPSMSHIRFEKIARVLYTLANQLSNTAFQNYQQKIFIQELQEAREYAERQEENLKVTLNSIGDAVITTDLNKRITGMNPVAEKLTGWTFRDAVTRDLSEVLDLRHSRTREILSNPLDEVLKTGAVAGMEKNALLVSRDGSESLISDSAAPIKSRDGRIQGVILVFRDVTQEFLNQEHMQQMQKVEVFGQLTGGIAHDFNNILTGITSAATLLKDFSTNLDDKSRNYIDMILKSSYRAASLTEHLLSISRRDSDHQTNFHFSDLVKETLSVLKYTVDRKITVSSSLNIKNDTVSGDQSGFQSMLMNIGINSSHAISDSGFIKFSLTNTTVDEDYCRRSPFAITSGEYCSLEIADNGCGIEPENLSRIFEPFFTTKERGKGTGLGLSSVMRTVRDHHCEISVESTPGVGTTFRILIPCSSNSIVKEVELTENGRGSGTVLLVDDEDFNRELGRDLLDSSGYDVLLASNGAEAISVYTKYQDAVDLVILDMMMPVMDGRETFLKLREMNPKLKIIIASGYIDDERIALLREEGLSDVILKPYRIAKFQDQIRKVLESS